VAPKDRGNGSDITRAKILSAAAKCFRKFGISKTTLDDIATASGLARSTVYRCLPGGRDEIIREVVVKQADRRLRPIALESLSHERDLTSQLANGLAECLTRIRSDPQLLYFFSAEVAGSTTTARGGPEAIMQATQSFLSPFLEAGRERGEIRDALTDDEITEWVVRVMISLLSFSTEATESQEAMALFIRRLLLPAIVANDSALAAPCPPA
jgi:AcrR family transcriptional regulator